MLARPSSQRPGVGVQSRGARPVGGLQPQAAQTLEAGVLVNPALKQQQRRVADRAPFTVNALQSDLENCQGFAAFSAHRGLGEFESLVDFLARSQPLQGIESLQAILLNQAK